MHTQCFVLTVDDARVGFAENILMELEAGSGDFSDDENHPLVCEQLANFMRKETKAYKTRLRAGSQSCELCPGKKEFKRVGKLVAHIGEYRNAHCGYVASTKQKRLARALFDQDAILRGVSASLPPEAIKYADPGPPKYIAKAAALMRSWVDSERAPILETLDKQSNWDDFVVFVLRGDTGPCFLPKLATADLRRCTRQVYYDGSFASLAFGFGLTCNGRPSRIFSEIQQHFRRKDPSIPAELLPKNANVMLAIMEDILELPDVGDVRTRLIQQATDAGQWVVVAHDATIKIMASVIGAAEIGFHAKHGSKAPQCVHTVRGMTGAVAKCVAAPTESREHCASAIKDALPLNARKQTKLLFTDNPKTFAGSEDAVVKTKRVFPNISCVAEDPMHLAFRTEDHFSQRKGSNVGKYIRRAQIKFANKGGAPVADGYFWGGNRGPRVQPPKYG